MSELQTRLNPVSVMPVQQGHYITALATQTDQIPLTRDEAWTLGMALLNAARNLSNDIEGAPV